MSEYPIPFKQHYTFDLQRSSDNEDNDSDCEVDGSFIILPVRQSVGSPSRQLNGCTDPGAPEVNLNVFQLGQRQASVNGIQSTSLLDFNDTVGSTIDIVEGKQMEEISSEGHSVSEARTGGTLNSDISNVLSCSSDSASSLEEANTTIIQLLEENKKLKGFVRDLNVKQKKFLDDCKILENAVTKSKEDAQEQERKYDRSRSVIETLRAKIAELEHELSTRNGKSQNQSLENSSTILRTERDLAEKHALLHDANIQIVDLKELLRKMEAELIDAKVSVLSLIDPTNLQNERDILSNALAESKITIAQLNQLHLMKQEELKNLQRNMETHEIELEETKKLLCEQLELYSTLNLTCQQKGDEIKCLTEKWQKSNNAVEQFGLQMESRESDIQTLKNTFEQLELTSRQKIASLIAEIDDKEVFRTQMEEYKSNFEEERKDKVFMKEEKNKLAEALARVQIQLEEKVAELQELHRNHLQLANLHVNSDRGSDIVENAATEEGARGDTPSAPLPSTFVEEPNFFCPICGKTFKSQAIVVNHASNCGEVLTQPFVFP